MALASRQRNSDLNEALAEARAQYAAARPASAAIHEKARGVLPGGNTRSVLFYTPFPTAMTRGEGCFLEDVDGHRYVDFCGEYTAGLFGHSEKRITSALHAAIDRGLNLAAVGEREGQLAALVCGRFPSLERVRFTNSGTEANMMALGAARAFTGRTRVLGFNGGYHGGLMTFVGGGSKTNSPIPVTLADYNDVAGTVETIRKNAAELAAVIIEPMVGSGGCIPASVPFLQALRDVTRETGVLLIFDEVMTSRHSSGGLQKLRGVTPDMTTLGKYMAGGMSFGAFGGRADVMALFDGHKPGALIHSGTFNNNVMTMAGGVVALGEIFDAAAADALLARGEKLRARLNEVCRKRGVDMQFTGIGSMMQPHFRSGPIERPYAATPTEEALRELYFFDLLAAGIYIARRGMIAMSLPIGDAECDRLVAAVDEFCALRQPFMPATRVA
ncbi:MAG TPA: aminotransferase class III-fold pyridoxal phosphate-dependent enzyme [Hyphomicrobiaceae bacterium]|nr:aminotransferase class III-fold pyridoxal phosphate-dependent enzyme [Hyphomicrobiaceae bacterium]